MITAIMEIGKAGTQEPSFCLFWAKFRKIVKIHKIEGNVEEKSCFPTMAAIVPEQKNKCKT